MAKCISDEMRNALITAFEERVDWAEDIGISGFAIEVSVEEGRQVVHEMSAFEKYRWHDLRENQDDIPKDDSKFLLCYIGINGEDMYMTWWAKGDDVFPLYIKPIAWCYINKFEVDQK